MASGEPVGRRWQRVQRSSGVPGIRRLRYIFQSWLEAFRQQLPAHGFELPPEAELCDLAKRALKSARRLLDTLGRGTVHEHQGILDNHIWDFVTK
jgi:hypothetical protein